MEADSDYERGDPPDVQRGEPGSGMRGRDYMDAYVFTGQELDSGASGVQEAAVPFTYAV